MIKEITVVINAPALRGAEISTLEFLRLIKDQYSVKVLVGEYSNKQFLEKLRMLGLKVKLVPMMKLGRYTVIGLNSVLEHVKNSSIIWAPHLGQPLLVLKEGRIPVSITLIGHIRDYILLCPIGLSEEYSLSHKCTIFRLIRCKQKFNYKRIINGYIDLYTGLLILTNSFIKGIYEYNLINYAKRYVSSLDGLIAISKAVKNIYILHLPSLSTKPFEVIYNPISIPSKIIKLSLSKNISKNKYTIIYASGFDYVKGLHILLKALRIVIKEYPEIKVMYFGDYNTRLNKLMKKECVDKHINIMGRSDHEDFLKNIAKADIVVLPSIWPEPFGRIAAEANMLGVPVVASNIGGLPEIVENGRTGFLVKPGDPLELAKGIIRALEYNFNREYIYKITYSKFNPQKIKRDFIRYIDKVIS